MERDSRKLIRWLERDGWVRVAVRGSHWQFKHPDRAGRITVGASEAEHRARHRRLDLPTGGLETREGAEMRYVAFVHDDDEPGVGVSFPDFPGCVSDGETVDDALRRGAEALSFHVEGMVADGEPVPPPRSLHDIRADESLAGWRDGATIAFVPLILDKGSPRRINVSLDFGLLRAIDEEAKRRGMTRSAFLSSAARNEIEGR